MTRLTREDALAFIAEAVCVAVAIYIVSLAWSVS